MTHIDIIITSTWRYEGLNKMQRLWKDRNMPGDIVGITPHLTTSQFEDIDSKKLWAKHPVGSRGIEIEDWETS